MTKAEIQRVRELLVDVSKTGYATCYGIEDFVAAIAILDAELERPEEREWRTMWLSWRGMEERISHSLEVAQQAHPRNVKPIIESRTPAGPWKKHEEPETALGKGSLRSEPV